ncbi:MAG: coniferyl aldehyde dehydrogenase [Gammaproteobacteria bacterium]|nr:coniferyl aldehyde dehydrogenase [Gammaproteobacteria bacterium]
MNDSDISQNLLSSFSVQRDNFLSRSHESYEERKAHLTNLKKLLTNNREELLIAISKDYGNRSYHESLFAEIIAVTDDINSSIKHLKKWMKVQSRETDQMLYFGAKNRVIPQPLGVVGLIIPWNFPINLSFSGLSSVFAAGNCAMVKMSENSIHLTRLLMKLVPKYFKPEKLQFFEETGTVGIEFSKIPFDHLMFTGSGATGRKVMAAAAQNLTPVTLELGGKSPAIIDPEYPLLKAVERIMFVKQFNAGQICTTVDYVFVHQSQTIEFIEIVKKWIKQHVPDINSKDFTSIIDDRAFQRLSDLIDDAESKGATIINLCEQEKQVETRKFPVTLVLDTTEDMIICNRETFGPILMVKSYSEPEEVIDYINSKDRPLALYPFTKNKALLELYIERIMSGGVTVNDALFHVAQHDLPFGGVGGSGMGHYHGYEGFITFSKLRPVFYQANITSMKYLMPPYGNFANKVFNLLAKLKS